MQTRQPEDTELSRYRLYLFHIPNRFVELRPRTALGVSEESEPRNFLCIAPMWQTEQTATFLQTFWVKSNFGRSSAPESSLGQTDRLRAATW